MCQGAHRADTNKSAPGATPQPGIHNAHKTIRQKRKDKWWQTKEAPTQSRLHKPHRTLRRNKSFFVFKVNEQPPSRVSAMAPGHNIYSHSRRRDCNARELRNTFTLKRRGTRLSNPTSTKARKTKNRKSSKHYATGAHGTDTTEKRLGT